MNKYIILFDGICNFCNFWINLVLKNDLYKRFFFSPLQSEMGQKYLKRFGLGLSEFETFIVVENDRYYDKSEAVLIIAKNLPFPFKLLSFLRIIPRILRDRVYSLIAKNRYKLFGKREVCRIPEPDEINRFLP